MTAPTSPGVVPADIVKEAIQFPPHLIPEDIKQLALELVDRYAYDWEAERADHVTTAVFIAMRAIMADRANRPSLTKDEREKVRADVQRAIELTFQFKNFGYEDKAGDWVFMPGELKAFLDNCKLATARVLRALADRSEPRQEKEGKA